MCYPLPAPRCSTHARQRLVKATSDHETAISNHLKAEMNYEMTKDLLALAQLNEAKKQLQVAEKEHEQAKIAKEEASEKKRKAYAHYREMQKQYDLSPDGIKEVRESGDEARADNLASERRELLKAYHENSPKSPAKKIDPRVVAILAMHVEVDGKYGKATSEFRQVGRERHKEFKELLASHDEESVLELVKQTHVPSEVNEAAQAFNCDRIRHPREMHENPELTKVEVNRSPEILITAMNRDTHSNRDKFYQNYFENMQKAESNPAVLDNAAVREAFQKRYDSLPAVDPADTSAVYREKERHKSIKSAFEKYGNSSPMKPKRDALEALGGKHWERDGMQRVYFDNKTLVEKLGGTIESTTKHGVAVKIDGEVITLDQADLPKSYYDLNKSEWAFTGRHERVQELLMKHIGKVKLPA